MEETEEMLLQTPPSLVATTTAATTKNGTENQSVSYTQIGTVFLLMVAFAFARTAVFIQILTTSLVAKEIAADHPNNTLLSTIPLSFLYYGGAVMAPIASNLMGRVGRRVGFIVGGCIGIVGASLAVLATYFFRVTNGEGVTPMWLLLFLLSLGSLLLGFANAYVNFFRFAAADTIPERKSLAISAVLFGGDVAALAGPSLSVWTKNLLWEDGASYVSLMVLFACTIFFVSITRMPALTKPDILHSSPPRTIWQLMQIPRFILALTTATIAFSMMVFLMGLTPLVMDAAGYTEDKIAHVIQVHSVGMFAPGLIVGPLIEYFGPITVDAAGLVLLTAGDLVMVFGMDYWNFMVGMFLIGAGWNFSFISSTSLLTEVYQPSEKLTTQGLNDFIMTFTVSSISLASGQLWKSLDSWRNVNLLSMSVVGFGFLVLVIVVIRENLESRDSVSMEVFPTLN